jgi:predicted acyl esterase
VVSYTSAPLGDDLLVVGAGAEIHSSSSSSPADIFLTLVDVAPDGLALNLSEGVHRQDCRPGTQEVFEVNLREVAHAFRKGHRIRLDVSGMSFPRFDPMPASGRSQRTIALGATGSHLTLAIPGL